MELQGNDLQKNFYSFVDGKNATFYLTNMHSVYGKVLAIDNFTILICPLDKGEDKGLGKTNLIYKSNIVNVEIDEKFNIKDYLYKQQHPNNQTNNNQSAPANQSKQPSTNKPAPKNPTNKSQSNNNQKNSNPQKQTKNVSNDGIAKNQDSQLISFNTQKHKPTETIMSSFTIGGNQEKKNQEVLDSLPDISIEPTENEEMEKVDNEVNINENKKEQAKYSPMSFLSDLQS